MKIYYRNSPVAVLIFIWYSCWATERSLTPWWITALLITFGFALYKLICDITGAKAKVTITKKEEDHDK